jgi:TPR repeat protein
MADIFVSYARDDRAKVEQLAKALEARGFEVWWDPELLPGQTYAQKIQEVLQTCKAVLVVWSKTSAARPWVLDEAAVGRDRGVLVPVLIEPVDAPLGFRQLQAEDLSNWPGAAGQPNFERLVRALEGLRGRPAEPPKPVSGGAFGARAGGGSTADFVAPKAKNRWPLFAGLAAIAVLGAVAISQIGGGGSDIDGGGPIVPPGSEAKYGLTDQQIAALAAPTLIEKALEMSSIDMIRQGAEEGDPLGRDLMCLANSFGGGGVTADAAAARQWCDQAAEAGSMLAIYVNSLAHRFGNSGLSQNQAEANRLLTIAAEGGDARAMADLGWFHLNGEAGFLQDDSAALSWIRRSAEGGNEAAQFNLAWMYENARAVSQDYSTALLWYQKLADQGSPIGIRAVGWMHYNGWGTQQDWQKAHDLYKQASDLGDGNASNNLASMYEKGEGVSASLDEAVRLYRLAESQGYKDARAALQRLGISD